MLAKSIIEMTTFIISLFLAFTGSGETSQSWISPSNIIESYYESMIEERLEEPTYHKNDGIFYDERRKLCK